MNDVIKTIRHRRSVRNFKEEQILDAAVCAENMMLAADSLGVGSCMIARATELFE